MIYVDLTHTFETEMSHFEGLSVPTIQTLLSHETSNTKYEGDCSFEITEVQFPTSLGTYLDAPRHRYQNDRDIADLRLDELIRPGVLLDFRKKKEREPITGDDIKHIWPTNSLKKTAALVWTGWDEKWNTPRYAEGPFLTSDAADALLKLGCCLVGIDTLNIDDKEDYSRPAHTQLLRSGCLIVENLTKLWRLCGRDFQFAALPIPIRNAASFPVRALGIFESG